MFSLLFILSLVTAVEPLANGPQQVIIQLKNGNRIAGRLLENDGKVAVVAVQGGEMRFDLRKVELILPVASAETNPVSELSVGTAPVSRPFSLPLPAIESGEKRSLTMRVPGKWKEESAADSPETVFSDPSRHITLKLSTVESPQSLWSSFTHLKSQYEEEHKEFRLKGERFGNLWQKVRTWEIDFVHRESGIKIRERHLYLDFGSRKCVLRFRTQNKLFDKNTLSFSSLVGSLKIVSEPSTDELPPLRILLEGNEAATPSLKR